MVKDYVSHYEFVKVNVHKAHTQIHITDMDNFGASLESDEAKEFDKRNNCKDTVIKLILFNKKILWRLKRSFLLKKTMKTIKTLFLFIAALGAFFLASNSEMQKKMNQNYSTDNEIKSIPVERFKPNK